MKIALIGYGYWGPNLAKNLNLSDKVEFIGICERDPKRLKLARSLYGDGLMYTTEYKELLDNANVEAVAIATPTSVSFSIVMDALNAKKDVFVEKPIAVNAENAQLIENQAIRNGCIVHCDHIMLYHPVIRYIKKMIDDGELGKLLYIDISRANLGPLRKDVNVLLDLAVHDLAVIDFLSNGENTNKISATGEACFGQQETLSYLTIKYETFIAHIKSSWISPVKERKTVIAGTKKMVMFNDIEKDKLTIYDKGFEIQMSEEYGTYEYNIRTGDIFLPYIKEEDSLRNSIEHFVQCGEQKRESLSGPKSSIRVMKILDSALAQLEENRQEIFN